MQTPKRRKVCVGDECEALWPADGEFYPARVARINGDGTLALAYADGDARSDAVEADLRRAGRNAPSRCIHFVRGVERARS